jgi:hypothetical protein
VLSELVVGIRKPILATIGHEGGVRAKVILVMPIPPTTCTRSDSSLAHLAAQIADTAGAHLYGCTLRGIVFGRTAPSAGRHVNPPQRNAPPPKDLPTTLACVRESPLRDPKRVSFERVSASDWHYRVKTSPASWARQHARANKLAPQLVRLLRGFGSLDCGVYKHP